MLHLAEHIERCDLVGCHVQECDLRRAVPQHVEVRDRAAVGDESDGGAVRGPGGLQIGVLVVGVLAQGARRDIPGIDVTYAPVEPRERDVLPVRRPCGTRNGPDAIELDFLLDVSALHVHDRQLVVSVGEHREHELRTVRRPVPGRVDEAQRVEVRIGIGADQLFLDLAGPCVSDEEVDPKEIFLRKKRDEAAIRAYRRRNVLGSGPGGWSKKQSSGLAWRLPSGHERQVLRLDRIPPLDRKAV